MPACVSQRVGVSSSGRTGVGGWTQWILREKWTGSSDNTNGYLPEADVCQFHKCMSYEPRRTTGVVQLESASSLPSKHLCSSIWTTRPARETHLRWRSTPAPVCIARSRRRRAPLRGLRHEQRTQAVPTYEPHGGALVGAPTGEGMACATVQRQNDVHHVGQKKLCVFVGVDPRAPGNLWSWCDDDWRGLTRRMNTTHVYHAQVVMPHLSLENRDTKPPTKDSKKGRGGEL
jgi:hypothetical protein